MVDIFGENEKIKGVNYRKDLPMEAKKNFVINTAFYAIILAGAILGYKYILPIMVPFIIGFCVASVVQIPLNRLPEKLRGYRKAMSTLFCIAAYAIVVALLILVGAKLVTEVVNLAKALPDLFQSHMYPFLMYVAEQVVAVLAPLDPSLADWIIDMGKNAVSSLASFATDLSASVVALVATGAVGIPSVIVSIIITVVSSFYMAADYRLILDFLKKLMPEKHRGNIIRIARYAETAVLVYIKSYSLLFVVTFLELWLGLSILNIPYAMGIALGIAIFDLMPVLGTGGVLLPWAVIALIMGNYFIAIGVFVLYLVITAVRNALEPRIVGNQIGLHPLATLIAMILGLKLMGLVGMMLFPITLVAVTNLKKQSRQGETV